MTPRKPKTTAASMPVAAPVPVVTHDYHEFLRNVEREFKDTVEGHADLFTTNVEGLFDLFLSKLPKHLRQEYTCCCCRKFVETFGGLVVIEDTSSMHTALWGSHTDNGDLQPAVNALQVAVERATVTGVFRCADVTWGTPHTGEWSHMAVQPPTRLLRKPTALLDNGQLMAEKKEDYRMLCLGLGEFPEAVVQQAVTLLTGGQLYRSEKCIGVAEWLLRLHKDRASCRSAKAKTNLTWLAVAAAPPGYCHVRSGMIGTLLEDVQANLDFRTIKVRFDSKMNPLQYQRPTAPPSVGNIKQAEEAVEKLGVASALRRRFARLEDVEALWQPQRREVLAAGSGSVFGHLKPKAPGTTPIATPAVTMTWDKFQRTVLPEALDIEFKVPYAIAYYAMTTAADPDAKPILQWDKDEARNPVSWYTRQSVAYATQWNLSHGAYVKVNALTLMPFAWKGNTAPHQGEGVFFILQGCKDNQYTKGAGFFVEQLKPEFHSIRQTLEAYVTQAVMEGQDEATACGICLRKSATTWTDAEFRVTSRNGAVSSYKLDRWD